MTVATTPSTLTPASEQLPLEALLAVSHCIRTTRSIRRYLDADVDPGMVSFVLDHAVQAGSAKNRQPWRFVIIRDPALRDRLGDWYRLGWCRLTAHARCTTDQDAVALLDDPQQVTAAAYLADNFENAPVVIVPCFLPVPRNPANFYGGASIYPAIQNLLLAARALGLGGTLTTIHAVDAFPDADQTPCLSDALRQILSIPHSAVPAAVITLGWPATPFSQGPRKSHREVAYSEQWDQPWPPAGKLELVV
jgi:nitroreductase